MKASPLLFRLAFFFVVLGSGLVPGQENQNSLDGALVESTGESPPDPFEQGRALVAKGELMEALPFLREAAKSGKMEAEELCALSLVRLNRPSLYGEARRYLDLAAEKGSVPALEQQARILVEGGLGEEPDYQEARLLLDKLVQLPGARESYFLLGKMAAEGLGRERDLALAVSLMRRGEAAGSASAMVGLGQLYLGEGGLVERDLGEAETLLKKAYDLKNGEAAFYLGMIEERLRGDEPRWEEARQWFVRSGDLGYAPAFRRLGDYAVQKRAGLSESDAFESYQSAAALGDSQAPYLLGLLYYNGQTVPKDQVAASAWMGIAADRGHAPAQNQMGVWTLQGLGVTPDLEKALLLFEKSAAQGFPPAQCNAAVLLISNGAEANERERALDLLRKSGSRGYAEAAARLAEIHREGKLVDKDIVEAAFWASKASEDDRFQGLAAELAELLSPVQKEELTQRLQKANEQ